MSRCSRGERQRVRIRLQFALLRSCKSSHERKNWLFAGSERAGQRAAAVQSLIQSARLNGLDPYAYLKDVLERLPTYKASAIEELLPHKWQPLAAVG